MSDTDLREGLEELGQREAEATGNVAHRAQAEIALSALDTANVVAVEAGPFGQRLLGQVGPLPDLADVPSHRHEQLVGHAWHAAIVGG